MKRALVFFCAMAAIASASPQQTKKDVAEILSKTSESPHRYSVTLAYIPNVTEGVTQPSAVYDAAMFSFRLQVLAWQPPLEALAGIIAQSKLVSSTDAGRWAAGVRIEDRTTSAVVLRVEISVPVHVIAINGEVYEASPEVIDWFRRELLPAAKALNKGAPIKDL